MRIAPAWHTCCSRTSSPPCSSPPPPPAWRGRGCALLDLAVERGRSACRHGDWLAEWTRCLVPGGDGVVARRHVLDLVGDRKSTRLNSSHGYISYAVFCLKKKKNKL